MPIALAWICADDILYFAPRCETLILTLEIRAESGRGKSDTSRIRSFLFPALNIKKEEAKERPWII